MSDSDFSQYQALSFDCYGTLIDWEAGLLAALREITSPQGLSFTDDVLLESYASAEAAVEEHAGSSEFMKYRSVLREAVGRVADTLGFSATEEQRDAFAASVTEWPPFADSCAALARLAERFELIILSNIDEDLFEGSQRQLGVSFRHVFTAEIIGSYKPDKRNFDYLIENVDVLPDELLHVAQSLYHDIGPARAAGLATVWVNRRAGKEGSGATPPSDAEPDHEVSDLASLADLLGA